MSDENKEAERWRRKYLEGLDELEQKERYWAGVEGAFRQAVSRLSLAAEMSYPALERPCDELRRALRARKEAKALLPLLDALAKGLDEGEAQKVEAGERSSPPEVLQRLLSGLDIPRGLRRKAKALEKRLTGAVQEAAAVEAVSGFIKEMAVWIAEDAAKREDSPTPAAGESLLGRLFSGKSNTADETPEPVGEAPGIEPAAQAFAYLIGKLPLPDTLQAKGQALGDQALQAETPTELNAVADALSGLLAGMLRARPEPSEPVQETPDAGSTSSEVLIQLLERLDFPEALESEVDALRTRLHTQGPRADAPGALKAVAELISRARLGVQREKQEIEAFLQDLTERLRELDQQLETNQASREAAVARREQLDHALGEEVQGIRSTVHEASELAVLKSDIQARIDHIQSQLQARRDMETARGEEVNEEVRAMTERMQALEQQTQDLQARLEEQRRKAQTDALTGLPNRMAFDTRAELELARWRRYRRPLVVAVADVDFFKRVNDDFGHKAGDKLLRIVARLLQGETRETDFVARYGGEEFVVLMPETDAPAAHIALEKLRVAVQECGVHFNDRPLNITISIGYTLLQEGDTPDTVFDRADQALYQAKEQGRNRCIGA